jgi:glutamine synthetase
MLTETWDYKSLDQKGQTIVEYVWIGGTGEDLRSKARTIKGPVTSVKDLPIWNYDGSSTYQARTENSEIEIVPVALFDDPFRGAPNKLVLCETRVSAEKITASNFRRLATKVFNQKAIDEHEPWFGIEQEYILTKKVGSQLDWPLGWTPGEYPGPQGMYYCGQGAKYVFGREICDAHYKACMNAGIEIYGTNAEVFPGQWEFQVGTCKGIDIADHLIMARFLLRRVAEKFGVDVTFEPKPFQGWNGSGAHTNFSTKGTREDKDMAHILKQLEGLAQYHMTCQKLYGEGNEKRLSGGFETSKYDQFSYGVMSRASSVRIPQQTKDNGNGYYEDRRPSANCDPYVVASLIFSATCLGGAHIDEIEKQYAEFIESKKNNVH